MSTRGLSSGCPAKWLLTRTKTCVVLGATPQSALQRMCGSGGVKVGSQKRGLHGPWLPPGAGPGGGREVDGRWG